MSRLLSGLVIVAVLLAAASPARAQLVIDWEATFGGLNADIAYDVQPTTDGSFIAVGFGTQGNFEHILVVKTDAQGQALWQRALNFNNYSNGDGVVDTADILLVATHWGAHCGA